MKNQPYKLIVELTEEQQAAVAQARQLSGLGEEALARIALAALCRHIERQVQCVFPLEIISTRELEGYKQTTTAPWRANAPCSTGTAGSRTATPRIKPLPVVLPG